MLFDFWSLSQKKRTSKDARRDFVVFLFFLFLFKPFKNKGIAVVAVGQAFVDAADGRCACAGTLADFNIVELFPQQPRNLKALRNVNQLLFRADIAEKAIAFFNAFKRENCLEKVVNFFVLWLAHS